MSVYYTFFYLLIVIFVWFQSHVRATYVINTIEYTENKRCVMRLDVEGHGVNGVLYTSCEDGRKLNIRAEDGRLKIGDRKDQVSAYSDKTGSLVVLDETGRIKQTFRSKNYELYKYYQGTTNEKPSTRQWTIINWFRGTVSPKTTASLTMKKPLHSDVVVIKSEMLNYLTNICNGKIKVAGNEIKYDEPMACHQVQDRRVVFSPEGVILHDYRGAIQSVIVSQESMVTINQDGSCNRMSSKNKASGRENVVLMDIPSCSRTKAFVDQYLGVRVYRYEKHFFHDILIRGRGLDHMLKGVSAEHAIKTYVKYSAKDGVLMVGNYRENTSSAFSDTPGTLVVLESGGKNCSSHTYKKGKQVLTEVLDEKDCDRIKYRIDNTWETVKYEEEGSIYAFSIVREVSLVYHKNKKNEDGSTQTETFERVQVQGNGINYDISDNLTPTNRLEQHTTPSGLVVCNYQKQDKCMVTEVKNMIVILKENCLRVVYDIGQDNKVRIADRETCDAALKKVAFYRNRKV